MADPQFQLLSTNTDRGVLVLTFTQPQMSGDEAADAVRQEILAALGETGAQKVVLDFKHVKYISSAVFRPLLTLRRKLHETNGQVALCGATGLVADAFKVVRLISTSRSSDAPFEMLPDAAAAVRRLVGDEGATA
jgi:anti-anti-sigma factor